MHVVFRADYYIDFVRFAYVFCDYLRHIASGIALFPLHSSPSVHWVWFRARLFCALPAAAVPTVVAAACVGVTYNHTSSSSMWLLIPMCSD